MKPKKQKRARRTIRQPLVKVEQRERASRHGKEVSRKSNMLTVAAGPTIMKGRLNGGGAEPAWWADHK